MGQKFVIPKTGTYRFRAVAMQASNGYGAYVIQGDMVMQEGDILMIVAGNLYQAQSTINGQGGDMTACGVYRPGTGVGIYNNWEPIVVSGGAGGGSSDMFSNVVHTETTGPSSGGAGSVDGDGGAGWLTRSNPRNGGTRGFPFVEGYGGGGAIGVDGDGDGATGGGGGWQGGSGSTSLGYGGSNCLSSKTTNKSAAVVREATATPYVQITFLG
jgi:hypothetical protein